jgi:hypothetical protein
MRLLKPASDDDMIAVFLAAEATSERYGPRIREILTRLGQPFGFAEHPDTSDDAANAIRRQVLAAYRGYPAADVFTGMPADVAWHCAALTPAELATVRYIDYPYWTDFSGGTRARQSRGVGKNRAARGQIRDHVTGGMDVLDDDHL